MIDQVEAGVAYLDEHHPGWAARIDLGELNLLSRSRCIMGQLKEDFPNPQYRFIVEHGFADMPGGPIEREWRRIIKERQDER